MELNHAKARNASQCEGLSFYRTTFATLQVFTITEGLVCNLQRPWCQVSGQISFHIEPLDSLSGTKNAQEVVICLIGKKKEPKIIIKQREDNNA